MHSVYNYMLCDRTGKSNKIDSRKIPLELRAKQPSRLEKYMHLYTDAKIDTMKVEELKETVQIHNLTHHDTDIEQLKKVLRTTRYLTFWHDHATMLGQGYIMMAVHTIFDPAAFDSTREDDKDMVQTLIEEPCMHMFGLNSSSIEDQATLILDRVDCLEMDPETGSVTLADTCILQTVPV